jgi:hypothetical protein
MYIKRLEAVKGAKAISDAAMKKAARERRAAKTVTLRDKLIQQGALK